MSDKKLNGKIALITGASKGLGRAMAIALGAAGARLVLVSRDVAQLEETKKLVEAAGSEAYVFRVDVTDEAQVLQLEKDVAAQVGKVQILINNAGINIRKPITDFLLSEWRSVIDTNLISAFLLCRSFVPHMKGTGYGRIVNLSSTMGHVSIPERSAYSASKAGVLGLTRALALELAPDAITVVAISPGPFATEMNTPILEDPVKNASFVARIPLGRWGKLEEIGQLAAFICSEEAGFITGTDILIDGGWCAQ
jgi:NAD(P)-dependent dehydrogenase (short-subunit alcohol dehydrogenase family)